ncbi:Holliday junction DNA helicase RuvA [Metamycoplasma cloacale]|uniref:Holliday junction branch migration complex subunit RuvA n=1 Tax=Metamycoplasma cloacale TaxID=92401 RepID=A0A2Z4LM42_9BACT|nr:Holliday junction branch migration protein RuvA [Metamycoplasma cloacale]AWX42825.1 Holliday junction branch migration protein RuvA [Metamycoplasma cloacale]VEU79356.1 Holliday junction DNA helicase RuvA [Metamycoplasma cloacale]
MTIYKYGKIVHVSTNYIILDHNGEGSLIYVAKVERFNKDEVRKVYISTIQNEYSKATYGFDNFKELVIFEDLINLQGLGPKTAIIILNQGWENIISWIANGNYEQLQKIPYVSHKVVNNMVFSLQEKYRKLISKLNSDELEKINVEQKIDKNTTEFENAMKMLGFKTKQIKYALDNMKLTNDIEKSIEEAIKIIGNQYHEQ